MKQSGASNKGRFIVLEGIDGAGKTTLLPQLAAWLRQLGHQVVVTREPGGTTLAEAIRALTKEDCFRNAPVTSKLLLLFAARCDLVRSVIQPALQQGCWVISDRFTEASYAYQGAGEGADAELIAYLESQTTSGVHPDMVLLLDLPVAVAEKRRLMRGNKHEQDDEALLAGFLERVRQGYLSRAAQQQALYGIIDAALSTSEVFKQAQEMLHCRFPAEIQAPPHDHNPL